MAELTVSVVAPAEHVPAILASLDHSDEHVRRLAIGLLGRLSEAAANVTAFNKSLRTIAVLSNTVSDALTVSVVWLQSIETKLYYEQGQNVRFAADKLHYRYNCGPMVPSSFHRDTGRGVISSGGEALRLAGAISCGG